VSQSTVHRAFIEKSLSLYWLGLYEASSIKVYPALFHVDYSGELLYSESAGSKFSLVNLTFVVAETAMFMFRRLFAILAILFFYGGSSYGFYHLTEMISPFTMPAKSEVGSIEGILITIYFGGWSLYLFLLFFFISLGPLIAIGVLTYFVFKGFILFFPRPGSTLL